MDKQIVAEARRAMAHYGQRPTAWEFREIVQAAQQLIGEGMGREEAVDSAVVLVLRLHAIEDPPWSERGRSEGPGTGARRSG